MSRCFECFKEHDRGKGITAINSDETYYLVFFCSDECVKEWHERTKDWKVNQADFENA